MKYFLVIVALFAILTSKALVCTSEGRGIVVKAVLYNNGPRCRVVLSEENGAEWILEKKSNDVVAGTVEISFNATSSDWHRAGEKSFRQSSVVDFILAAAFIPNANPFSDVPGHACHRMMSLM